jgi:hypothetical protein
MGELPFPWTARRRLARLFEHSWCLLGFTCQLLVQRSSCASSQSRDLAEAGMKGVGGPEPPFNESPPRPQLAAATGPVTKPARRPTVAGSAGSTVFDRAARVVGAVVA